MDTICAVSTARAVAAIGVVRVSGPRAAEICGGIIKLRHGTLESAPNAAMRLGRIYDGDTAVDEVLCTLFRAPNSYTGEDVVEINCHGGLSVLDRVMRLLIRSGARSARAGEFTKRAFLNGKLDLIQAEAVGDLIDSSSEADAALALGRMSGGLSEKFSEIYEALVSLGTEVLAYIDFPDEGLSDVSPKHVLGVLNAQKARLESLKQSFSRGAVIRDGADTAIIGAPNVGKSTLLNAILGCDRAIVSDVAGTTRDVVSERAVMGKVSLNLADTAGIRAASDEIERRGVELARGEAERADLILAVFDGSRPLSADDKAIAELCEGKTAIALINKSDLPQNIDCEYISARFVRTVHVSAKDGAGLDALSREIEALYLSDKLSIESGTLLTSVRHYERVCAALERVNAAKAAVEQGFTPDVASVDIAAAASEIGLITGAEVSERMIDDIFSKFCVGK